MWWKFLIWETGRSFGTCCLYPLLVPCARVTVSPHASAGELDMLGLAPLRFVSPPPRGAAAVSAAAIGGHSISVKCPSPSTLPSLHPDLTWRGSQLGDGCHCAVPPPGEKDADKARAETTEGASYKWRMVIAYDGTKFKGSWSPPAQLYFSFLGWWWMIWNFWMLPKSFLHWVIGEEK